MANYNFHGAAVLITRPKHQSKNFVQRLQEAGGKAVLFPTVDIIPSNNITSIKSTLGALERFNIAIFISANAVSYTFNFLEQFSICWPKRIKIAAIGESTAKKLSDYAQPADWYPQGQYNSEALLDLAPMRNITGKRIVIVRGHGGREFLAERLRARGASIHYLEVYQRRQAVPSNTAIRQAIIDEAPQIISTTSFASLAYLVAILPKSHYSKLYQRPLIVVNTAMLEYAQQQGFHGPILVAKNATDQSIIESINEYFIRCNHAGPST